MRLGLPELPPNLGEGARRLRLLMRSRRRLLLERSRLSGEIVGPRLSRAPRLQLPLRPALLDRAGPRSAAAGHAYPHLAVRRFVRWLAAFLRATRRVLARSPTQGLEAGRLMLLRQPPVKQRLPRLAVGDGPEERCRDPLSRLRRQFDGPTAEDSFRRAHQGLERSTLCLSGIGQGLPIAQLRALQPVGRVCERPHGGWLLACEGVDRPHRDARSLEPADGGGLVAPPRPLEVGSQLVATPDELGERDGAERVDVAAHEVATLPQRATGAMCRTLLAAVARKGAGSRQPGRQTIMTLARSYWPADTSEAILETTVGSVLRDAATAMPERTAIVAYGLEPGTRRSWTFAELLRDAERTARALLGRFEPGEHVAVWANNVPEWLLLEFGAALAKLVLVTVNPAYRPRELDYVLRQSRAAGLFHVRGFRGNRMAEAVAAVRPGLPHLREVVEIECWEEFLSSGSDATQLPAVRPDDPAQIQYTSGTTGFPKGALLHHRGITNNARFVMQRFGMREADAYAHPFPFFHTAGCVLGTLGPIQKCATQVFPAAFEPGLALAIIERERATHVCGVPTVLIAMMEHPDLAGCDVSSVRTVGSGGALVPPDLVRAIEARFGANFGIIYGQTEASPVITQVPLDASVEDKAGTIGPPLPQTEVKIVDPATRAIVPPGIIGELCTRGYLVMHGYFDMAKATAEAIDPDGWLHTGDLATMDERGYCRIAGRLKEMVIRGGENLFPAEIEAVLHEHPAVVEAAVVGVPDPRMGEELAAFIRAAAGRLPDEQELRAHVRGHLAAPKTPRYWIVVDEFPLTGSGKIQKFVLRERWEKGEFGPKRSDR